MGDRVLQAGNLFLLGLAAFYLYMASSMQMWRGEIPGPAFMPTLLGIALATTAILLLVQEARRRPVSASPPFPSRLPFVLLAVLLVYLYLLPIIGYPIANALLLLFCFRIYEARSWRADIVGSLGISVGLYLLFVALLQLELPMGSLFEL